MTRDKMVEALKANLNKTVTLKFNDGFITQATPALLSLQATESHQVVTVTWN